MPNLNFAETFILFEYGFYLKLNVLARFFWDIPSVEKQGCGQNLITEFSPLLQSLLSFQGI